MEQKILIEVRGGVAYVKAATQDIRIVLLDYDGLDVGEGLEASWEYPENIWTHEEIEKYAEEQYELTKPEENEY
jgi:hypothetical protein